MDVNFAALISCLTHEVDGLVEAAGDVFLVVVLQVEAQILDPFVFEVIFTVVGCTVDHMSNTNLIEGLLVLGNNIGA